MRPRSQWGFVAATVVPESGTAPGPARSASGGSIEIEFVGGARMWVTGAVDAATLKAAVAALSISNDPIQNAKPLAYINQRGAWPMPAS
jgi:hypothetical protein